MALSTGQINDAYQKALGRLPSSGELNSAISRGDLEGSPGQQQLMAEISGGQYNPAQDIPAFKFDFTQAEQEARAKLEPYYAQKLADAKGDVERAKRLIEEDYNQGLRFTGQQREEQLGAAQALTGEETRGLTDTLNRRGVLLSEAQPGGGSTQPLVRSGLAQQEFGQLEGKQNLRKMAIERALQRQEEVQASQRKRGIEEQNIQYPRQEQNILEEKEKRVQQEFVPAAYERAYQKYNETYGQSLREATNRPAQINQELLKQLGF